MVTSSKKEDKTYRPNRSQNNSIKADVIILGCSLPGIVTAHKLKKKFGNTVDIMVLDLSTTIRQISKGNVAFQAEHITEDQNDIGITNQFTQQNTHRTKMFLNNYALDLNIHIPPDLFGQRIDEPDIKIFQHVNGLCVELNSSYHDFEYLNFLERFELKQYQRLLDDSMHSLFKINPDPTASEQKLLLYYDQTSMEKHLSGELLFETSKEIMRTTVRLVCGASPKHVSVLFFLHQCFRTSSCTNYLDGDNVRIREKVLGYCRKRIATTLKQSTEDITLRAKPIREIRTHSNEEVILETMLGETNYICNLLAMALSPEQLKEITVETRLMSENEYTITQRMIKGRIKSFLVQYETNIWRNHGYSGDIVSVRGPIMWAIERPQLSGTGATEKYATLMGYLNVKNFETDHKAEVVEQLVSLFGEEARNTFFYSEKNINDIIVPGLGDYLKLYRMTVQHSSKYLVWAAFDIFADGDVAAAIEAGHRAYLHLISLLRPQSENFDDLVLGEWPSVFQEWSVTRAVKTTSIMGVVQYLVYGAAFVYGVRLLRSFFRR